MKKWQRWVVVGLMGILFAQLVLAIPKLSLTADEPVYMGAGYAFLRSGDLRMATSAQHPPLMQELVALPLLLQPGPELEALEGWSTVEMVRFAPAFVAWYADTLDAATFAARFPVVMLTMICAALLFRWAADWFGPWGGMTALTLFAFDPNILAHGTLATNDIGFATFSFVALFAATRLTRRWSERSRSWSRPAWSYLILTGVALGAALASKSSGFFTALALAVLFVLVALFGGAARPRRLFTAVLQFTFVMGLGLLVLWATYAFEWRPLEEGGLSVPMATQWEVWREMRGHLAGGHTNYLMGELSETGWRGYYPLAIALKTPLATLVLLVFGLVVAVAAGPRRWLAMLPLWIFLGGYLTAVLLSRVNTGYRFLLPALPFFFLLVAGLFREGAKWLRPPSLRWVAWAALLLLGAAVAVPIFPHYLTFFNRVAGGPSNGHRYLVDSNLDWGQSFKALRAYLDASKIDQLQLSHYTYTDPALYGIRFQPLAPLADAPPMLPSRFNPAPGIYAIGATTLQGVMTVDPDLYSWFRQQKSIARPGHAIFVFQVREKDSRPTWVAQCTVPVAPLTPEAVAEGFGSDGLRLTYFDCTQSWLYPEGGATPGWYALRSDAELKEDRFIKERLGDAQLIYEQRQDRALPAFVIYEQLNAPADSACALSPQSLDGPLSFLGYTAPEEPIHPGETVDIETCWRVKASPQDYASSEGARPLSLMLHLIGPNGAPVVVGDGLGVPVENWRVGDAIVQRHQLQLPGDAPAGKYAVYAGAYWLDTMERWSVQGDGESPTDQIELAPLEIRD